MDRLVHSRWLGETAQEEAQRPWKKNHGQSEGPEEQLLKPRRLINMHFLPLRLRKASPRSLRHRFRWAAEAITADIMPVSSSALPST